MKTVTKLCALLYVLSAMVSPMVTAQENDPTVNSWMINTDGTTGSSPDEEIHAIVSEYQADVQHVYYNTDNVYVETYSIPSHPIGPFSDGNPAIPVGEQVFYRFPRIAPGPAFEMTSVGLGAIGIFINGVAMYNYSDAESYEDEGIWLNNAIYVRASGFDSSFGHPSPNRETGGSDQGGGGQMPPDGGTGGEGGGGQMPPDGGTGGEGGGGQMPPDGGTGGEGGGGQMPPDGGTGEEGGGGQMPPDGGTGGEGGGGQMPPDGGTGGEGGGGQMPPDGGTSGEGGGGQMPPDGGTGGGGQTPPDGGTGGEGGGGQMPPDGGTGGGTGGGQTPPDGGTGGEGGGGQMPPDGGTGGEGGGGQMPPDGGTGGGGQTPPDGGTGGEGGGQTPPNGGTGGGTGGGQTPPTGGGNQGGGQSGPGGGGPAPLSLFPLSQNTDVRYIAAQIAGKSQSVESAMPAAHQLMHNYEILHNHVAPSQQQGGGTVTGFYHYHQQPILMRQQIGDDGSKHSPVIGYMFDGAPVYGPYGYDNTDGSGGVVSINSGYRLRTMTDRSTLSDGTVLPAASQGPPINDEYPLGYFVQDYEHVDGHGHLDEYNGRFAVTPDYPEGVYAYFATIDENGESAFPYLIGPNYYGEPIEENSRGGVTVPSGIAEYQPVNAVLDWANY